MLDASSSVSVSVGFSSCGGGGSVVLQENSIVIKPKNKIDFFIAASLKFCLSSKME